MSLSVQLEGGLGNKLFQLAFIEGLSKKFPEIKFYYNALRYYKTSHETVDWSYFTKTFKALTMAEIDSRACFSVREEFHRPCRYVNYEPGLKDLFEKFPTSHIDFFGYFQSEKYFDECRDEIYKKFGPTPDARDYLTKKYPHLDNAIFLHVRRGDNMIQKNVIVFDVNYYIRALEKMRENIGRSDFTIYVCSDDYEWCGEQDLFSGLTFVRENEITTLWLMSMCKLGGITANSTFSWWGGYLNENPSKVILFPDQISCHYSVEDHIPACFTSFEVGDIKPLTL